MPKDKAIMPEKLQFYGIADDNKQSQRDFSKAFAYAKNAAENGDKEGEYVYATFLLLGRGCNADVDRAYEYFSRSYNHGFEQAKLMIEKIDKMKSN